MAGMYDVEAPSRIANNDSKALNDILAAPGIIYDTRTKKAQSQVATQTAKEFTSPEQVGLRQKKTKLETTQTEFNQGLQDQLNAHVDQLAKLNLQEKITGSHANIEKNKEQYLPGVLQAIGKHGEEAYNAVVDQLKTYDMKPSDIGIADKWSPGLQGRARITAEVLRENLPQQQALEQIGAKTQGAIDVAHVQGQETQKTQAQGYGFKQEMQGSQFSHENQLLDKRLAMAWRIAQANNLAKMAKIQSDVDKGILTSFVNMIPDQKDGVEHAASIIATGTGLDPNNADDAVRIQEMSQAAYGRATQDSQRMYNLAATKGVNVLSGYSPLQTLEQAAANEVANYREGGNNEDSTSLQPSPDAAKTTRARAEMSPTFNSIPEPMKQRVVDKLWNEENTGLWNGMIGANSGSQTVTNPATGQVSQPQSQSSPTASDPLGMYNQAVDEGNQVANSSQPVKPGETVTINTSLGNERQTYTGMTNRGRGRQESPVISVTKKPNELIDLTSAARSTKYRAVLQKFRQKYRDRFMKFPSDTQLLNFIKKTDSDFYNTLTVEYPNG